MKKVNLIVIATIIGTFLLTILMLQPTAAEASKNVLPSATPSPRKIKQITPVIGNSSVVQTRRTSAKRTETVDNNELKTKRPRTRRVGASKRQHKPIQ